MTTAETESSSAAPAAYAIRPDIIEAHGRSLGTVVGARLCPTAVAKLKDPRATLTMTYKELRNLAKKECSDDLNYLSPQAPVLETAFKLLLVAPGDWLSAEDLHSAISDLWMTAIRPRHISIEALTRVLNRDSYYGIVRVDSRLAVPGGRQQERGLFKKAPL